MKEAFYSMKRKGMRMAAFTLPSPRHRVRSMAAVLQLLGLLPPLSSTASSDKRTHVDAFWGIPVSGSWLVQHLSRVPMTSKKKRPIFSGRKWIKMFCHLHAFLRVWTKKSPEKKNEPTGRKWSATVKQQQQKRRDPNRRFVGQHTHTVVSFFFFIIRSSLFHFPFLFLDERLCHTTRIDRMNPQRALMGHL